MIRSIRFILGLLAGIGLGCQSHENTNQFPTMISQSTATPDHFSKHQLFPLESEISIPDKLLKQGVISRNRAEPREGPGLQYQLTESIFPKGEEVIILSKHSYWKKVLNPKTGDLGWIHEGSLKTLKPKGHSITIQPKKLPKVFAIKNISRAYEHPRKNRIDVKIPKGRAFYTLRQNKDKILVIIVETKSLLWLSRRHAQ